MGEPEGLYRAGEGEQDLARGDAVGPVRLVQIELALVVLEGIDAARIDDLDRQRLRCAQGPGHVILEVGRIAALGERAQQEVVVAEQDVGALVHHRRIGEFEVGLARIGGEHGRFEAGDVTHLGVAVTGGARRRCGMAAAEMRARAGRHEVARVILGQHHARDVHPAAADVGVDVDGPGHHHAAVEIDDLVGFARIGRRRHDASCADVEIAHLAVDAAHRIVEAAAFQSRQHGRLTVSPRCASARRRRSAGHCHVAVARAG